MTGARPRTTRHLLRTSRHSARNRYTSESTMPRRTGGQGTGPGPSSMACPWPSRPDPRTLLLVLTTACLASQALCWASDPWEGSRPTHHGSVPLALLGPASRHLFAASTWRGHRIAIAHQPTGSRREARRTPIIRACSVAQPTSLFRADRLGAPVHLQT